MATAAAHCALTILSRLMTPPDEARSPVTLSFDSEYTSTLQSVGSGRTVKRARPCAVRWPSQVRVHGTGHPWAPLPSAEWASVLIEFGNPPPAIAPGP